jgi:hypothetical protein
MGSMAFLHAASTLSAVAACCRIAVRPSSARMAPVDLRRPSDVISSYFGEIMCW